MKFQRATKPLAEFSFSSLTDIVMLLLIFFILTSQFVVQTGVKVQLPDSKKNEQTPPSKFVVTIDKDGATFIGPDPVPLAELAGAFTLMKQDEADPNLIIRADKEVPVELVIKVIDSAREAGIDKFTIQTEKPAGG